MATFQKRGTRWRAIVRKRGHKSVSKTFSTKGMAQRWARETEVALERGEFKDSRRLVDITVGDLIRRLREESHRIGRNKGAVLDMLLRELGELSLAHLTKQRIIEYGRHRAEDHGAGPSTIGQDLIYLGGLLDTARSHWDIPVERQAVTDARAVLRSEGLVGSGKERDRRPQPEELELLHKYWQRPTSRPSAIPMWDIVRFAIGSAMRLSEITGLLWEDLDEADRTVVIRDRKHPKQKLGNDQVVPLLGETWELVQAQPRTSERIFPYNAQTVSTSFGRAVMRCGIADLRFHDLRHHGVSLLFEQGYQLPEVALVSGHRDWRQLRRYTQIKARDLHR